MNKIFSNAKIQTKLPMAIAGLMALTIMVLSLANAFMTQRIVANAAAEKLESAAILKGKQITRLLNKIDTEIRLRAADPSTSDALIALVDSYQSLEDAENVLQRAYIEENAYPLGEKDKLVQADTGSSYDLTHATYHPALDVLRDSMGYYDIFLFDTDGNLVYSVFKEDDFATNMITGPWANTGLAQAYRAAAELADTDPSAFVDFAPYTPSQDAPAAFIARPVFDAQGVRLGVLAYQMPVTQLNEAASDLEGFGKTADGFVVGSDFKMRTDSPMTEDMDILSTVVDHPAISAALAGTHAIFKSAGNDGQKVTGFAEPLSFHSTQWVVVVQQNTKELYSGLWLALLLQLAVSAAILIVAGVVSVSLSRSISTPLLSLTSAVTKVAAGKTDITVPHTDRGDEIGELARKTEIFRQNAGHIEKMMSEQKETSQRMNEMSVEREKAAQCAMELSHERERIDQETRQQREEMMRDLGESFGVAVSAALDGNFSKRVKDDFDDKIFNELSGNINDLMTAVDFGLTKTTEALARVSQGDLTQRMTGDFRGAFRNLQGNVNSMMDALTSLIVDISHSGETLSGSSSELQQTADVLSRQAAQNAASFEETAAAVEEMTASMAQVNTNMGDVRQNADDARATATESANIAYKASESMERIARGSQEINRVTDVINDIAFQINLLALNAGVEAARAGDAGRGFSVVASEVRLLAQRASEAVKEIAQVLSESDAAVNEGVTNVSNTKTSLDAISAKVISISESVHNVTLMFSEQASTMNEISSSVAQVDSNTQKQSAAFEELTASSQVLSNEAYDLEKSTSRFQLANKPKSGSMRKTSPSGHSNTPLPAIAVGAENFEGWG